MADQDQTTSPPPEETPAEDQAAARVESADQQPAETAPDAPQEGELLDSALKEEIEREVDAAFADDAAAETDAAAAEESAPGQAESPSGEQAPATESEATKAPSASAAEADLQQQMAATGLTFDDDEAGAGEAKKVLMEEMGELEAAAEQSAEEPSAAEESPPAEGEDQPSEQPPDEEAPQPEEAPAGEQEESPESSQAEGDAVAETERAALLEEQPAEDKKEADDEGRENEEEDEAAETGSGPGRLLLPPLRALVFLLNLIDRPFRGVGPGTRDILGKLGIAYLIATAMAFAYVLLRPLFS